LAAQAASPSVLGAIRVTIGTTMLARPMLLPRPLGVDRITAGRISWLVRMVGARDFALGVGTLAARRRGGLLVWLGLAACCDAVDAVALGRATRRGDVGPVMGALATATAVGGVALSAVAITDELARTAAATGPA
jgi:hypothetical protein